MKTPKFILTAQPGGGCVLSFDPPDLSPKRGLAKIGKNRLLSMKLNGLPGDPIKTATFTFTDKDATGWPFQGQETADFVWANGQQPVETIGTNGTWMFSVTLLSKAGNTFLLPDPELQVGDGPGTED